MKTKFLLIAIIITAFFSACKDSEVSVDDLHQDVEVTFDAILQNSTLSQVKADQEYDRDDAPVYVSGLQVTATNLTYSLLRCSGFNFHVCR